MNTPLAHSPRPPVEAQEYAEHSAETERLARQFARATLDHLPAAPRDFVEEVGIAAALHDLGKLDPLNQEVLERVRGGRLPVAHEDAGVAALLRAGHSESATLVAGHHAGLFSQSAERQKQNFPFRNLKVRESVDAQLDDLLASHRRAAASEPVPRAPVLLHSRHLQRRLAMSCLVDADHSDTARHYGAPEPSWPARRWAERAHHLDEYVRGLGQEGPRDSIRAEVFQASREAEPFPSIRTCDAPVGSGKTTAVMAHLLQVAQARDLRHIFVVVPFVSVITQHAEVLRRGLVLPGEDPEHVVAENHHQVDFESVELRHLAAQWRSPIILTTAVQFFETLAAARPAVLRKLHEVAGSALFIDEAHAALPAHLWPQAWKWLCSWADDWGGHAVLASGTLPRFWELDAFGASPQPKRHVPDLLPEALRSRLVDADGARVARHSIAAALPEAELVELARNAKGPSVVVLNSVKAAAVVATRLRALSHNVCHLSGALAPIHLNRALTRVRDRLLQADGSLIVVSTSLLEAGLDISFRTGFRQTASTASFLQLSGRINRHGEFERGDLWDFRLRIDPRLPDNPSLQVPRRVLLSLFEEGRLADTAPFDLALMAMDREWSEGGRLKAEALAQAEDAMEYPKVAELFTVIDDDTRLVVIDRALEERIRGGAHVGSNLLSLRSVRIRATHLNRLPVEPISGDHGPDGLFAWRGEYDPEFLGYMADPAASAAVANTV